MSRVSKGVFSHSQTTLRNSIDLTRKAYYWGNREVEVTNIEGVNSSENKIKESEEKVFSAGVFFVGAKESDSEAEIVATSLPTPKN